MVMKTKNMPRQAKQPTGISGETTNMAPAPPSEPMPECRMYEEAYPENGATVMVRITQLGETSVYVALPEYNNAEGMVLVSDLTKRRFRSLAGIVKVGQEVPMNVIRVDKDRGYIDLSKRAVQEAEREACTARYSMSKLVHSIMRRVAEITHADLEELYRNVGWPLYKKYGHAYEAFQVILVDPGILDEFTVEVTDVGSDGEKITKVVPALTQEVKEALIKIIERRMTPKPIKLRADIEMKCFEFDGVLHIKSAMRAAERAGIEDCPVKIKSIAAPLYVLSTNTTNKAQGISVLNAAIQACKDEIESHKGKLVVKVAPRTVSESEDQMFLASYTENWNSEDVEVEDESDASDECDEVEEEGGLDTVD